MNKSVSIIVPAYNASEYIDLCLKCLIKQSYSNYEIIVIDDGSTDETSKICDCFAKKNNNIKVFHTRNNGAGEARNIGLSHANGDYICFVDADDMVESNYIEGLVNGIIDNDLSICSYDKKLGRLNNSDNLIIENIDQITTFRRMFASDGEKKLCYGYLWNKLFRKDIIEKYNIKFQSKYIMWEDMHFCCQYVINICNIGYVNNVLYHYNCTNNESISHKISNKTMKLWIEAARSIELLLGESLVKNTGYDVLMADLYMKKLISGVKLKEHVEEDILNYLCKNKNMLRKKYNIYLRIYVLNPEILIAMRKLITV